MAVELDGEVQVGADFGDGLSGVDGLADGDEVAVVVSVGGDEAAAVVDADPEAVAGGGAGGDDGAFGGGEDGGAGGGGDVESVVEAAGAWPKAAGEVATGGGYPDPGQWGGGKPAGGVGVVLDEGADAVDVGAGFLVGGMPW